MKKIVAKEARKIIVRAQPEDAAPRVYGLAAKLAANDQATLTQRERDWLIVAIAQRLGIVL